MKIFPTKEFVFRLNNPQDETLESLKRRTEYSENLTSSPTDKAFRGKIHGTKFKIISSAIGRGAFCVMKGEISVDEIQIKVEVHKAFKILLSIILLLPIAGLIVITLIEPSDFSPILLLATVGQILVIRYAFLGFAFRFLSKSSLRRLEYVLDLERKTD